MTGILILAKGNSPRCDFLPPKNTHTTQQEALADPGGGFLFPFFSFSHKCKGSCGTGAAGRAALSAARIRGILSFEKERIPLDPCSAKRCSPRGTGAAASFALVRKREKRKQKAPAGIGEGFLLCFVCIIRREKITSGGVPLCKY